jgi:integrase
MYYGPTLEQLPPDTAIWISLERGKSRGQPLGIGAIADVCEKYLGTSRVHATRHTFAHGMDQVGASVSEIQARLGHESLATTGQYLSRLKSAENKHAERLAALFGIE